MKYRIMREVEAKDIAEAVRKKGDVVEIYVVKENKDELCPAIGFVAYPEEQ